MSWRAMTHSLEVTNTNCRASPRGGECLGMSDMLAASTFDTAKP